MKDIERVIGALQEYQRQAERRMNDLENKTAAQHEHMHESMNQQFSIVRNDIASLKKFKWKAVGGIAAVSAIVSLACEIAWIVVK